MYKESYMATADGTQTVSSAGVTQLEFNNLIKDSPEGNFALGLVTIPPFSQGLSDPPDEVLYYIEYTVVFGPGIELAATDTVSMSIEIDSSGPSFVYSDIKMGGEYSGSFEVKMANVVPIPYDWPMIRYIRPAITITGLETRTVSTDSTLLVVVL